MKRFFCILVFLPLLFASCYIFDYSGNSRIALRLGTFPADVKKVHLAVFEGYQSNENLLLTTVLTSGSVAEVDVPAGENRYFIIVGENYRGEAEYLGASGPYSVSENNTTNISIQMNYIEFLNIIGTNLGDNLSGIYWEFLHDEQRLWITTYDVFVSNDTIF